MVSNNQTFVLNLLISITYYGTTKQNVLVYNDDYLYLPQILAMYVAFFLSTKLQCKILTFYIYTKFEK